MNDKKPDADRVIAGWQETIREVEANKDGFVEISRKQIATTPTQAMNDKTLVERLRNLAEEWFEMCDDIHEPLSEAADTIEALQARIEALEANNARLRLALQNTVEAVAIWAKKPLQETRQRNPSDQASWDQIAAVVGAMVNAALENSDGR